jgi:membrane protease YdiL (CAAX protease family)
LTACMVLAEELLFRGLLLRNLRATWGDWPAIRLSALFFGVFHVIGSPNWGMGLGFQFLLPALGGMFFAWAAVRSGGLALPIGLHWGGNWIQASVAGFSSPAEPTRALWQIPISASDFQRLTAPDFLVHLPYLAAMATGIGLIWYWLRATQRMPGVMTSA